MAETFDKNDGEPDDMIHIVSTRTGDIVAPYMPVSPAHRKMFVDAMVTQLEQGDPLPDGYISTRINETSVRSVGDFGINHS